MAFEIASRPNLLATTITTTQDTYLAHLATQGCDIPIWDKSVVEAAVDHPTLHAQDPTLDRPLKLWFNGKSQRQNTNPGNILGKKFFSLISSQLTQTDRELVFLHDEDGSIYCDCELNAMTKEEIADTFNPEDTRKTYTEIEDIIYPAKVIDVVLGDTENPSAGDLDTAAAAGLIASIFLTPDSPPMAAFYKHIYPAGMALGNEDDSVRTISMIRRMQGNSAVQILDDETCLKVIKAVKLADKSFLDPYI